MPNAPIPYAIEDFSLGWDNTSKPTTLAKGSLKDIENFNITRHTGLEKRGGMALLYDTPAEESKKIETLYEYEAPDKKTYLLAKVNESIKSYYEGVWNPLKTGLTPNKRCSFATHLGLCYGVNGVDPNFKLYNTTPYQVGITPPISSPGVQVMEVGEDTKTEEYASENQDNCGELGVKESQTLLAQTFQLDRNVDLTKVAVKLKKIGSPTGNIWVEIHKLQAGTSTTKNASTNIVGQGTANLNVGTITDVFATYELSFTGTKPSLVKNTAYYLVVYRDYAISDTDFILIGFDNTLPTYNTMKVYWEINDSLAWTAQSSIDLVFEIYGTYTDLEELVSYGSVFTGYVGWLKPSIDSYALAQSFQISVDSAVGSIKVALRKAAGTSGWLWAEIHSAQTGFSFAKNGSENIVGKGSDDIQVTSLSSDYQWVEFFFNQEAPSLADNTTYYLVIYICEHEDPDIAVTWTRDPAGTYANGCAWEIDVNQVWTSLSASDFSFKVYGSTTAEIKACEYAFTNLEDIKDFRETGNQTLMAQSFLVSQEAGVTRVKLYASKIGTPTGNMWVEIHDAQSGTSISKGISTYIVGEASDNVDISTAIGAFPDYDWVEFVFNGEKPYLYPGRTYYLVAYGDYGFSASDRISVGMDKINPQYASGKRWDVDNNLAWTPQDCIDLIFEIYVISGGLNGDYKYKYCYKRTAFKELTGNPSEPSILVQPEIQSVKVSMIASSDPQVDKIILYRTLSAGEESYYKAVELPNVDQDYEDSLPDDALTILMEDNNTVPPKSKFVVLHKDRIFYLNCPDEESGSSLVMWSKSGKGEAVPSANHQYFDRDDGKEIIGGASLGDHLLVFKSNKIGVLAGDLSEPLGCELWYLSLGIGCIASWAILALEDKVIFLSEEGWKATDGTNIYNLSPKINGLIEDGYITIKENENYSIAYYPEKEQFHFLMNHSTLEPMVTVGHFLVPLLLASKGIIGISEKVMGNMVGWTYHQYDYHTLTCLGNYTDANGITRVVAGGNGGYVYLLDTGQSDCGSNISTRLRTDWLSLGRPQSHTKITRKGYLGYCVDGDISLELQEDVDFQAGEASILTGANRGIEDSLNESFDLAGSGELFRYTLSESSARKLSINALTIQLRDIGIR